MTTGPQYPPIMPAAIAPAWRWHGYGEVTPLDVPPARANSEAAGGPPNQGTDAAHSPTEKQGPDGTRLPMGNQGSDATHLPTGSDAKTGTEWKPSVAPPAVPPPAEPVTPPLPRIAEPISAAEPGWRSGFNKSHWRNQIR